MNHNDDHDDFGGLVRDIRTMSRRGMFGMMAKAAAGLALVPLIGCTDESSGIGPDASNPDGTSGGTCTRIPSETAGPYPGDGTNGANALTLTGIERSDIRASIGTASGVAAGVEFRLTVTLVDAATCEPLVGYAVYAWHCDQAGAYSMYAGSASGENYLRGVQVTDASGKVTFVTVFPGCYSGRWPHIHFEIFASRAAATSGTASKAVSQLALPKATCDAVYATSGYSASVTNLAGTSLASDMVFSDGSSLQVASITGSVGSDLAGALTVAIAA
jgi:protocatechuate 3,4-dioxygenase beta subunit